MGFSNLQVKRLPLKCLIPLLEKSYFNDDARYIHLFEAVHFWDYIQNYDRPKNYLSAKLTKHIQN